MLQTSQMKQETSKMFLLLRNQRRLLAFILIKLRKQSQLLQLNCNNSLLVERSIKRMVKVTEKYGAVKSSLNLQKFIDNSRFNAGSIPACSTTSSPKLMPIQCVQGKEKINAPHISHGGIKVVSGYAIYIVEDMLQRLPFLFKLE